MQLKKLFIETVCGVHFKAECIESHMTKSQLKFAKLRVRHRLKTGSVPTELLEFSMYDKILRFENFYILII